MQLPVLSSEGNLAIYLQEIKKFPILTADEEYMLAKRYKEHGDWVYPVFPSNLSLQGSPPTPYIFDDRPSYEDAADGIKHFYDMSADERKECGEKGVEFVQMEEIGMTAENMSNRFIKDMDTAFEKWTPRKRFTLYKA